YSVFAQGTYQIPKVENLSLTLGARYTWDDRSAVLRSHASAPITSASYCRIFQDDNKTQVIPGALCKVPLSTSYSRPTFLATVDYKLFQDTLFYVSYRTGYRSGGLNIRASTPFEERPFQPETLDDVEVGVKSEFDLPAGMKARTNVALYYDKYKQI